MPTSNNMPKSTRPVKSEICNKVPTVQQVIYEQECPDCCDVKTEKGKQTKSVAYSVGVSNQKPNDMSTWTWKLKQQQYGAPPTKSQFRTAKYRWQEKPTERTDEEEEVCEEESCQKKKKYINPFSRTRTKPTLSGPEKRKIVERWGKMWDSSLSDFQFQRTVFENNPDGEQMYRSDNERINDGCQKLCAVAKMNQNVVTTMMKKFVSGPPSKLYTLNRIEAAQCWSRIINDQGVVKENCCIDLPLRSSKRKFNISSLNIPKSLRKHPSTLQKMSLFKLPSPQEPGEDKCPNFIPPSGASSFKRNPTYWLDPKTVPPVPRGFKEEEFQVEAKDDPTGEIRRDLMKNKETAKRYTRFAHIIEKAIHVIPNLEKVNQAMDEHFVAKDLHVRRQTLLHNFFSSPKMETSPDFKRDAMYATILSRNDNPRGAVVKKQFPYSLAVMTKSKSRTNLIGRAPRK